MSGGLQLVEPHVEALVLKLRAGLTAEVDIANAEAPADTDPSYVIETTPDDRIHDHVPPVPLVLDFPTIGIQHGDGQFEDDQGWSATGRYELAVVVFDQADEPARLSRMIRRQLRTIARVALADRKLASPAHPSAAWGMTVKRINYGPMLGSIEKPGEPPTDYMTYATLVLEVKGDEE